MLRTITTTLAIIAAVGVPQASAQMSPLGLAIALRACQQITDDAARLKCFDAIGKANTPAKDVDGDAPNRIGAWHIQRSKDAIDDTESVGATLPNVEPSRQVAYFTFRCKAGELNAWVSFPREYFTDDVLAVTYRLDTDQPEKATMFLSSDNHAYGIWNASQANSLLAAMIGRKKLAIRIEEKDGGRAEAVFDLADMEAAFQQTAAGCME